MTPVDVVALVSLACGIAAALGWSEGYHSFTSYVALWLFGTLAGVSAVRFERLGFPAATLADRLIRSLVIAFALVVLCGLLFGSIGWLQPVPYLGFFGISFVLSIFLSRSPEPPSPTRRRAVVPWAVYAIVAPILVFVVAIGITRLPIRYDSLNYHLYFPAEWLQAGRISIVPTPFGDEAPAYAPSNGELFFLSLMLPLHGDLVARIGQFPFYLLIGVVQYALARLAGAKPEHAVYPAAFFLLARPIVEEAVAADVDLIFTAMFLSAVYLGIVAVQTNARNDWIIWGASVGLCCGTKYVSLVYVPVFLALAFVRGPRPRALWALPGLAVLALPWYVRNWTVTGSPIYPSSLTIAGRTLAPGAFTHGAMANSIFHVTDFRIFAVIASTAFGGALYVFWIPLAAIGTVMLLRTSTSWPARFLVLLPAAMVPLDWFAVPDNTDPRFLFPIIALALLPLAFVFPPRPEDAPKWNRAIQLLYGAALVWLVVGANVHIEPQLAALPYFMRDALSFHGLVATGFLPFFGLVALAAVYSRRWLDRGPWLRRTAAVFSAACILVGVGSYTACRPKGCDFLDLTPTYIKGPMFDGWRWVEQHAHGETIAYAGDNIPYPLFGERLTNRVSYVNIDRHIDWKLHDYDRARRRRQNGPDDGETPSTLLATSSGILQPAIPREGAMVDAVRPRFERMSGYRDAWVRNLKLRGVTLLFVSTLSAYEVDNVWHDAGGFPIEAEWAKADPEAFRLVFQNSQVLIYAVGLR